MTFARHTARMVQPSGLYVAIVAVLGTVLVLATVEGLVLARRRAYGWRAYFATLGDVVGLRAVEALGLSLAAPLIAFTHQHRIATLPLDGASAFVLLFLG